MLNLLLKKVSSFRSHQSHPPYPEESNPTREISAKSDEIHITDSQKSRFSLYPISTQLKRTFGRVSIVKSTSEMPPKYEKGKPTRRTGPPNPKEASTSTGITRANVTSLFSDLEKTEDHMTGQDPKALAPLITHTKPIPRKSVSIPNPSSVLVNLGEEIKKEDDSLSPNIMSLVDEVDKSAGPFNPTIRALYSKTVGLVRNDFWQIKGILTDSTKESPGAFHLILRSIVSTYQIATAKDVGAHLSDISALRDDMATKAREMEAQERNNKTFLESMTRSWNNLAKNMTLYNETLEKKILESSTLQSSSRAHLQATKNNNNT